MKRSIAVHALALMLVFAVAGTAFARPTYNNKVDPLPTSVSLVAVGNDYYQVHVEWDVNAGKPVGAYFYGHMTSGGNATSAFQKFTRAELLAGEATLTNPGYGGFYIPAGTYDLMSLALCSRKTESWIAITPVP